MLSQQLLLRQHLGQALRIELRQLLKLELHSPVPEEMARGLDGMYRADRLLKERGVPGILIGGLASAAWNSKTTPVSLAQHKDVDVAVMGDARIEPFEQGIDWWMPGTTYIKLLDDHGSTEEYARYWRNGNDVVLRYEFGNTWYEPGLHLPDRSGLADLLAAERVSTIHEAVDARAVIEPLRNRFERSIGKRLAKAVRGFPVADCMSVYEQPSRKYTALLSALEKGD